MKRGALGHEEETTSVKRCGHDTYAYVSCPSSHAKSSMSIQKVHLHRVTSHNPTPWKTLGLSWCKDHVHPHLKRCQKCDTFATCCSKTLLAWKNSLGGWSHSKTMRKRRVDFISLIEKSLCSYNDSREGGGGGEGDGESHSHELELSTPSSKLVSVE